MTNLQLLWEAEKDLTFDEKRKMADYLVGALSAIVDPKVWQRALDAAMVDHNRRKQAARCA